MGANKKRRILSLILTLALLMTMYVPVHADSDTAHVGVTAKTGFDAGTIKKGDVVSVTVGLVSNCKVSTVSGGLIFDKNLFECTSIKNADGNEIGESYYDEDEGDFLQYEGFLMAGTNRNPLTAMSSVEDANLSGSVGFALAGTADKNYKAGDVFTATFEAQADGTAGFYLYEDSVMLEETTNNYKSDHIEDSDFSIVIQTPKSLADANVLIDDQIYTGSEITLSEASMSVFADDTNEVLLEQGVDYEILGYDNNVNAGTAIVHLGGLGAYAGSDKDVEFTINKATPVLSFPTMEMQKTYGAEPFCYPASGSDNITYSSSNEGAATVADDGTVTIVGVGNTLIMANAVEDDNHNAGRGTSYSLYVVATSINGDDVTIGDDPDDEIYNGGPHTPEPVISFKGEPLVKDTDYELSYEDNVDAGTATMTIQGIGNFKDQRDWNFTIYKARATAENVAVESPAQIYESTPLSDIVLTGDVVPSSAVLALKEGQTLSVGTEDYDYTMTLSEDDAKNYDPAEDGKVSVTVLEKAVDSIEITTDPAKMTYKYGEAFAPEGMDVIATYSDGTSGPVSGFTFSPETFDTVGDSVTVTVSYAGKTDEITVKVEKADQELEVSAPGTLTYGGEGGKLEVTGCMTGLSFDAGEDSPVSVAEDGTITINSAGSAVVTVTAAEDEHYNSATKEVPITVDPADIRGTEITVTGEFVYNGEPHTPEPAVTFNGETLVKGTDYILDYEFNVDAGTAFVGVTGIGNFTGDNGTEFTIGKATATAGRVSVQSPDALYVGTDPDDIVLTGDTTPEGAMFEVEVGAALQEAGRNEIIYYVIPQGDDEQNYEQGGPYSLEIEVLENALESIEITVPPATVEYVYGDSFDSDGMVVTGNYANGDSAEITDYTVSPETFEEVGEGITVTVSYEGKTAEISVTVAKADQDIDVSDPGILTYGGEGGKLEVTGYMTGLSFDAGEDGPVSVAEDGTITINKVGETYVTVIAEEDEHYNLATKEVYIIVDPASIDDAEIAPIDPVTYSGEAFTPEPAVTFNGETLTKGSDYTLDYSDNTNAGIADVIVNGTGNFTGSKTVTFEIEKADQYLSIGITGELIYGGDGAALSVSGYKTSYSLSIDDGNIAEISSTNDRILPLNAGSARLKVTAAGNENYNEATLSMNFEVYQRPLTDKDVSVTVSGSFTYNGEPQTPEPVVTFRGEELVKGTDYTLEYSDNIDAGPAIVYVNGIGNFSGTAAENFYINQADQTIEAQDFSVAFGSVTDLKTKASAEGELSFDAFGLPSGTRLSESTLTAGNTEGSFSLLIRADSTRNYSMASKQVTVTVTPKTAQIIDLGDDLEVTYGDDPFTLTAEGARTAVKFTSSNEDVVTVDEESGEVNIVGKGQATITAAAEEDDTYASADASCSITVNSADISSADIEDIAPVTYDGSVKTPEPEISFKGRTLQKDVDYTLSYVDNESAGRAFVTIWGEHNFIGDVTVEFTIKKAQATAENVGVEIPEEIYESTPLGDVVLAGECDPAGGELTLDAGQSFTAGTNDYAWTYIPIDTDNYLNAVGTVSIEVLENALEEIELVTGPAITVYKVGESFDPEGMVIKASFADGTVIDGVDTDELTFEPETFDEPGEVEVTVTYKDQSVTVTVTVEKGEAPRLTAEAPEMSEDAESCETQIQGLPENIADPVFKAECDNENVTVTVDEDGKITVTNNGAKAGETVRVTVTVTSGNYEDAAVEIEFTVSEGESEPEQEYKITVEGGTADRQTAKEGETVTITWTARNNYSFTRWSSADDGVEFEDRRSETTTFVMPAGDVTVTAAARRTGGGGSGSGGGSDTAPAETIDEDLVPLAPGHQCPASAFSDVDLGAWYHEPIDYVLLNGLMEGVGGGRFAPKATTTRAMIVTILWRLEGQPAAEGEMPFTDVPEGKWFSEPIKWAAENGVVEGYGGGLFGPDDYITREQFVTILWRYAQLKGRDVSVGEDTNILSYDDAFDISEWAMPAMQWACGSGLMEGRSESVLAPQGNAGRAEAATFFMRFADMMK